MRSAGMMLALASMMSGPITRTPYGEEIQPIPESIDVETRNKQNAERGLKEFELNGVTVWALNHKNAIKKYNKMMNNG
jgi:hypothetical protein